MADLLPFDFNKIINYANMTTSQSSFVGYTYNAKSNSIKMDISNTDNIKNQDEEDEFVDAIVNVKKHEKDINQLKSQLKSLHQKNEELQSKLNQGEINANTTPIVAGSSGTTGIDHKGIYSHEVDNPDNMVRFQNGTIGISRNGDKEFLPIITKDGINPRFLQVPVEAIAETVKSSITSSNNLLGGGGSGSSGGGNSGESGTGGGGTPVITTNPKIKYIDLPCKIIRDSITKKVVRIEYYKDGILEYMDTFNRDATTNKVISIITEHVGKETETTTVVRDTATGKVTDIDVVYVNEDATLEYAGMK